jgi:hypothetical protein
MILLHAKSSVLRPTNVDKIEANSKLLDENNGLDPTDDEKKPNNGVVYRKIVVNIAFSKAKVSKIIFGTGIATNSLNRVGIGINTINSLFQRQTQKQAFSTSIYLSSDKGKGKAIEVEKDNTKQDKTDLEFELGKARQQQIDKDEAMARALQEQMDNDEAMARALQEQIYSEPANPDPTYDEYISRIANYSYSQKTELGTAGLKAENIVRNSRTIEEALETLQEQIDNKNKEWMSAKDNNEDEMKLAHIIDCKNKYETEF